MDALWLRNPLGILAEAPGGIVVQDGRIVELLRPGSGARLGPMPCSTPARTWCCPG